MRMRRSGESGFTLVELMVGMLISSLIVGSAYAAYLAASGSWEKSRIVTQHYQHARVALAFMEQRLRSALPPDEDANIVFEGEDDLDGGEDGALEADSLLFVSGGDRPTRGRRNRLDLCELEFFLEPGTEGDLPALMVRKRTLPTGGYSLLEGENEEDGELAELAPGVVGFEIEYLGEFDWADEWTLETSLPRAVEVTLTFSDPDEIANDVVFSKLIVLNTQ